MKDKKKIPKQLYVKKYSKKIEISQVIKAQGMALFTYICESL